MRQISVVCKHDLSGLHVIRNQFISAAENSLVWEACYNRTSLLQDPILGITEAFNADNNPEKMNLGVVSIPKQSAGIPAPAAAGSPAAQAIL